jgi:hypothetical protein
LSTLATEIPDGVVVSGGIRAHEGARVAVLHVDGLFRLDAVVVPDNLRLIVRNMSGAEMTFEPDGYPRPVLMQGDDIGKLALRPGHHQLAFTLGDPGADGHVEARVVLATLRALEDGTVRITAQATVRRAAAAVS